MRLVDAVSLALGIVWNAIAVSLLGGKVADVFRPSWLVAGMVAGVAMGRFTVWSRERRGGAERLLDGIATYYLGIVVYWLVFVVIERASVVWRHGGWTDFNLHDHLVMIVWFLIQGTFPYGIVLIPLAFLSRRFVWSVYERYRHRVA